jgi:hypothetical protein
MIYLKTQTGQHVVILEPGNIEWIKQGGFERSGDNEVMVSYTPDAVWLSAQLIANVESLTPDVLAGLVLESQSRPEVKERPSHPPVRVDSSGGEA